MMERLALNFELKSPRMYLKAEQVTWDSHIFRAPVAQILQLDLYGLEDVATDFSTYQSWVREQKISMVSCRLEHQRLRESMLLEEHGFRFIEMVLHPYIKHLQSLIFPADTLQITPAVSSDLIDISAIAETAFSYERFHLDYRLNPTIGNKRYGSWVTNTLKHKTQRLLKVSDGDRLIGFFIIESVARNSIYWHLTAINPEWQGRGYGLRVWRAMLNYHKTLGFDKISTTISARNIPVLNLYAKLGFRFTPPNMTFHWIKRT
jgi:RimJ/RimL family protein N-acetyltransferase